MYIYNHFYCNRGLKHSQPTVTGIFWTIQKSNS